MKICEIKPLRGLFEGKSIRFFPGINLIRGDNGIGKTAILEYASLLGHISIMEYAESAGDPSLTLRVVLSLSDREFLDSVVGENKDDADLYFASVLKSIGMELEDVAILARPTGPFELHFYYNKVGDEQLKSILAHEKTIKDCVKIRGTSRDYVKLVQILNLWTRPLLVEIDPDHGKWLTTPRFVRANGNSGKKALSTSAPVFYFNTDMYEFGTGLDIRESPKHLKKNLAPVLLQRLQLVSYATLDFDTPWQTRTLDELFRNGGDHSLSCCRGITNAWKRIFPGQEFGVVKVRWDWATDHEKPKQDFRWSFKIGGIPTSEFVSSGQNQAFFLLAVMHGLVSEGSCMLLDEPELHLAFSAGTEIVFEIFDRAFDTASQAILVTHLPHLHEKRVRDMEREWEEIWEREAALDRGQIADKGYDYQDIRMIYVYRKGDYPDVLYDMDAMRSAASASHTDVMKLVLGLRLTDKVALRPSAKELRRDILRLIPGMSSAGEPSEAATES